MLKKSLKSISEQWFDAICRSYFMLGLLVITWCGVAFSLVVLGALK